MKDRIADQTNYDLAPPGVRIAITIQGRRTLGCPNYLPRVQPTEDRYQFADNLSLTRGRHQYKLGLDIAHTRDVEDALFNGTGSYTYGTISLRRTSRIWTAASAGRLIPGLRPDAHQHLRARL